MPFDFACPDWWDRMQDGRPPFPDLPLDRRAAKKAVDVFDFLRLPDVPGQPLLADAAGEWFRDIVRAVFGSVDRRGVRQVGEVFCLVPKKNSKTTNSAALALTFMLLNQRRNADMLIVGPTQKIAETAFEAARGMIEADPEGFLQERLHVQAHLKTIRDRVTGTRLMIRTFGMDVLTGVKPIFCLFDEVHILGTVPYAADVLRQIRGGMVPFPEALLFMITTQSDHAPRGVFRTELQYARGVRDGRITERVRLLPVLYEFPEDVQTDRGQLWRDPGMWGLVCPNIGLSIDLERLIDAFERAQHDGHGEVIAWATQHLNVEVGLALHSDRWRGADHWEGAGHPEVTLDHILDRCEVVVAGIDGGGLDDLMGLAVIGRDRDSKAWLHWAHAWAHPEVLEQRKEIAGLLHELEQLGQLTICATPTEDVVGVADILERVWRLGLMPQEHAIGYDPYGIAALVDEVAGRGIPEAATVGIGQGSRLSPAVWGLERKLKDGTFLHGGQELMAWSVGNAVAEQRGNAVLITKQTAGKSKIDPLVATFNAFMLMARNPHAKAELRIRAA